jgi:chaperonin GroEL
MTVDQKQLNWNVIDESHFRARTRNVFEQVAKTLRNTLGPYGANTIIEKLGEYHFTKDGWQVLKKIAFDDTVEQNILQLLVNISAQVVIKVGDGSTSSIVSANSILKQLESSEELKKVRSKDLIDILTRVVNDIATSIQDASIKIDPQADPELSDIYRLAMISTNGDKVTSEIIQTIYKETLNPFIEFDKAKSAKTSYEIIDGYQANITYLDAIFATNDEGQSVIDKPYLLMFDHKIEEGSHFPIIQQAVAKAFSEHRRLVVIAPHYDKYLLERIAAQTNAEIRGTGTTQAVYARVSLVNNIFQEYYNDFSIMAGGTMVREANVRDFYPQEEGVAPADVSTFLGSVDKITIGPKTSLIQGFTSRNETMYEIAVRDAKAKYAALEETHRDLNIVDSKLYELKKRLSKLTGIMGIIHVGGNSSLEKQSNYDLVEDAVKACESAFNYGYNIGGNLIIPITIKKLVDFNQEGNDIEQLVYFLLYNAFLDVFTQVLGNKFTDTSKERLLDIARSAVSRQACYDLLTDTYSTEVINPCHTDIEILRAAISIVSLILSSNQYISIKINKDGE